MKLTRERLFDAVWATPLTRLAVEFNTTSAALVSACEALDVPRPTAGHWQRVALGKDSPRPTLPNPTAEGAVDLRPRAPRSDVRRLPTSPMTAAPTGADLVNALQHPLIEASLSALKAAKPDQNGIVHPPVGKRCLAIRVSPAQLERALAVFATVLANLSLVSGKLDVRRSDRGDHFSTWASVDGESFELILTEHLRAEKRAPTPEERRARFFFSDRNATFYSPKGELTLKLLGVEGTGARQKWTDTTAAKIEVKAGDFVAGLVAAAAATKERRAEHERASAEAVVRRKQEEQRRLEAARHQANVDHTFQMSRQWQAARELREFVDAAETFIPIEQRTEEFRSWVTTMRMYACQLNPLDSPEKALRLLPVPDAAKWLSDEALGLARPNRSPYPRTW